MPEIQKDNFSTENQVKSVIKEKKLRIAVHIHQFAELVYIIEGETTVRHNRIQETAKAGDVVAILPYHQHGFFTEDNKKVKYWMLLFSDFFMSDIVHNKNVNLEYGSLVFKASDELRAFIESRMFNTNEEAIEPDFEKTLNLKALIYAAFSEYFKSSRNMQKVLSPSNQISSSDPVTKTVQYLQINFRRDVSIEDCAKKIGYCSSHISHCLQKHFHTTFLKLRNNLRVSYAKHLIRFSKMSTQMIGAECGFNSELTFNKIFKQSTKLTPKQYRKAFMNLK